MKLIKLSFLFYFLIFTVDLSGISNSLNNTQVSNDSLRYYYDLVYNTKRSLDLIKSLKFYTSHKDSSLKSGDTLTTINDLRIIASIQYKLNSFYDSEESATRALELLNFLPKNELTNDARIGIYNHIGLIYSAMYDYGKALEYYDKLLAFTKDPIKYNIIINNKALALQAQGKSELALKEFQKAYDNSLSLGDRKMQARALDNLGYLEFKMGLPLALEHLEKALDLRIKLDYSSGIFTSYQHLSEFYLENESEEKALLYANKALKIARAINSPKYIENALSTLININGDKYVVEYKKLKDSLVKANRIEENKYAAAKYNYSRQEQIVKETNLKLQESQLLGEKEKIKGRLYLFVVGAVIIASIFIYLLYQSKFKKKLLDRVNSTETKISVKLHDEVANDMFHLMTKMQDKQCKPEDIVDEFEIIYSKTRNLSKLYSPINSDDDFKETLNDLILNYKSQYTNILVKGVSEIKWYNLSLIKKTALIRILQELLINMKKHSKATIVFLVFKSDGKRIILNYSDNGIGCELKKGMGLQNVENRITSINGTVNFDSELHNGFKAKISV